VVVKPSWSIASLTRGFFSLGSDTPPGDHPVTDKPDQPESGWKTLTVCGGSDVISVKFM